MDGVPAVRRPLRTTDRPTEAWARPPAFLAAPTHAMDVRGRSSQTRAAIVGVPARCTPEPSAGRGRARVGKRGCEPGRPTARQGVLAGLASVLTGRAAAGATPVAALGISDAKASGARWEIAYEIGDPNGTGAGANVVDAWRVFALGFGAGRLCAALRTDWSRGSTSDDDQEGERGTNQNPAHASNRSKHVPSPMPEIAPSVVASRTKAVKILRVEDLWAAVRALVRAKRSNEALSFMPVAHAEGAF
jgi:hypothetical protein